MFIIVPERTSQTLGAHRIIRRSVFWCPTIGSVPSTTAQVQILRHTSSRQDSYTLAVVSKLAQFEAAALPPLPLPPNTLNLFLRSVAQGCPCLKPADFGDGLVTADSRFSLALLQEKAPSFAHAVQHGYPWIVLAAAIRTEEPGALAVISEAENILGSIQRLAF